jgi:dipeptidyl aminopeptidase/acylaminoacyl peptidase
MADNPLVHVPGALPALTRVNALRRRIQGRVTSFDLIQWDKVAYGERKAQHVHMWEMNDLCPRDGWPAVLLIHGGGWKEGSWKDYESLAPQLSRKGLMVAAMDYRLAPDHPWPAQLEDVLGAIDFLRGQLTDPDRIALWGHSAGGHLAMMAAFARPDWVRSVVALGAPSSLEDLAPLDVEGVFTDKQLHDASPIHQVCEETPPILLVHGTADAHCSIEQARAHAASRPEVSLLELEDGDHGVRWPPLGALKVRRKAIDWMVEQMDMPERGSKWRRRKKGKR